MADSLFSIFYKKIEWDGSNYRVAVTKKISNLPESINGVLEQTSIETFSNFYSDFFNNKRDIFKKEITIKTNEKETSDFLVYSTVINRVNNKIYLIEIYNENNQHLKDIFKYLHESDFLCFVVYHDDKVIFTDKGFEKITGYNMDNLNGVNFSSIFNTYFSETVKILSEKRKLGLNINHSYRYVPFKVINNNSLKYFHIEDITINYKGLNAGCMFFLDVTNETGYKDIYGILYKLYKVVSANFISYESFFYELCKEVVSDKNLSFVWVGDVKGKRIKPLASEGYDEGYLDYFLSVLEKDEVDFGPTFRAIRNNIITINPDTKSNVSMKLWQEEMLKRNFLSSCAIPICLDKEQFVLNLYANKEYFFNENILDALKILQEVSIKYLNNIKELELKNTFFNAIENTYDWVLITDRNGTIEYVNNAVLDISGYTKEELIGANPKVFKSGIYGKDFYKKLWDTIKSGNIFKGAVINKKKSGELFQIDNTIIPILENGEVKKFVSIAKDISKEVYLEEEVDKFSNRDILTGLLNRNAFIKNVDKVLESFRESGSIFAVFIIDIFDFAKLNEIYGFDTCNNLLKKVSILLESKFYKTDILSRVGSDSFGIFVKINEENHAFKIINKILDLFKGEVKIEGKSIKLDINIGAAFSRESESASNMISKAEVSLNLCKTEGANTFKVYNNKINKSISEYFEKVNLIKESIESNYFIFHLQPIYDAKTLKIKSFEALVRINHPDKGLIYPNYFIDFIENSDLLYEFEEKLIKNIIEYEKTFCNELGRCIGIAVNISAKSFLNRYILDYIKDIPEEFKDYINLEITERVFLNDVENTLEIMNELKDKGFKIEIDDFGTGFSSLSFIDKVPADIIKIDMTFVNKMVSNPKVKSIVKTIIDLSKNLDIKNVAEGVETKEQLEILKDLGCDYLQGYYFAKPMPLTDAIKLLKGELGRSS